LSVLSDLAVLAEERTDAFAEASDAAADAEASYLRCFFSEVAKADPTMSNAARERLAEAACVEEKVAWVHAQAAEKVAKQSVVTVLARLSAAQSHFKFQREQT
jgi:hypothetical protein